MKQRGILLLAVPVIGASLLSMAFLLRRDQDFTPLRPSSPQPAGSRMDRPAPRSHAPTLSPSHAPLPAPPEVAAQASEDARIRSTYQNYRSAVAAGNSILADALRPLL